MKTKETETKTQRELSTMIALLGSNRDANGVKLISPGQTSPRVSPWDPAHPNPRRALKARNTLPLSLNN
jgi:hypothetical protein